MNGGYTYALGCNVGIKVDESTVNYISAAGAMSISSGSIGQYGFTIDNHNTTLPAGLFTGFNLDLGSATGGTYRGIRINEQTSSATFGSGATVYGIDLDLNSAVTATGTTETGIAIATSADTAIAAATKTGLSITTGAITEAAASTGTYNGINLFSPGAISTSTAAGTLNWNAANLAVANATANFAGSTINANGLKVTTGSLTNTAGSVTENGISIDIGGNTGSATTLNGLKIAASSSRTLAGTPTGILVDLDTNLLSSGNGLTGIYVITGSDSNITNVTKTGLQISTNIITQASANTGTYNGISLVSPGAIGTTTAAGTLNWNAANLTVANATANFAGSTINANGLKVTTGSLTQTAGTLNENGLLVDSSATTFTTGGTLKGVNLVVGDLSSVANYTGLNISTNGVARTFSNGAAATGINIDFGSGGSGVTDNSLAETGISIKTSATNGAANYTRKGLYISAGDAASTIVNSANTVYTLGADIQVGSLFANTSSSATLNAFGLRVQAGAATTNNGAALTQNGLAVVTNNLTQTAGTLTENGLLIDSSNTAFTTGGTLNGININLPSVAAGTYRGINISATSSKTFSSGTNITGMTLY